MSATSLSRASGRRRLKLLAQQLSDPDIARISTFLRVGGDRLQSEWVIVFDGDADLLLLGNEEPDTVPGMLDNPMATLRIVEPSQQLPGSRDQIVRPLQYEPLIEALEAAERKILSTLEAIAEVKEVAAAAAQAVEIDDGIAMRKPQTPAPFLADALSLAPGASFKLRRWPPASVLQRHRYCVRLASFLSARHVPLDELARLSNVDLRQCEDFVAKLIAVGILDVKLPNTSRPAVPSRPVPVSSPSLATRPATPGIGLLHRVRRSLGII